MNRSARMGMGAWGARWPPTQAQPTVPPPAPPTSAARRMEGGLQGLTGEPGPLGAAGWEVGVPCAGLSSGAQAWGSGQGASWSQAALGAWAQRCPQAYCLDLKAHIRVP